MTVKIGSMRWVVVIETPPTELSDLGEVTGDWSIVGEDRAEVKAVSGSNAEAGLPQRESVNWYEIHTRYNPAIQVGVRLTILGEPYDGLSLYLSDAQHALGKTVARCFERKTPVTVE